MPIEHLRKSHIKLRRRLYASSRDFAVLESIKAIEIFFNVGVKAFALRKIMSRHHYIELTQRTQMLNGAHGK